jgi:hypothetical protein
VEAIVASERSFMRDKTKELEAIKAMIVTLINL